MSDPTLRELLASWLHGDDCTCPHAIEPPDLIRADELLSVLGANGYRLDALSTTPALTALDRIEAALDRHGSHNPGSSCIECGDVRLTRPWKSVMREIVAAERATLKGSTHD